MMVIQSVYQNTNINEKAGKFKNEHLMNQDVIYSVAGFVSYVFSIYVDDLLRNLKVKYLEGVIKIEQELIVCKYYAYYLLMI